MLYRCQKIVQIVLGYRVTSKAPPCFSYNFGTIEHLVALLPALKYSFTMINISGFPLVAKSDAKILILGTMPGQKSLEENQYYAHPRNSFWPIMSNLLKTDSVLSYDDRKKLLIKNNIALWDVLKNCYRKGSLDSDIDQSTIETNDFKRFFSIHKRVVVVFFNGAKAEQLFMKNSFKKLKHAQQDLSLFRLPSTSSAYAARTFEQKLLQWAVIKQYL